jgi:hypothetical protein
VERVRCYGFNVSGIYINGTYGQVITSIYGAGFSGAEALILTNNTTGVITENIQNYRRREYLIKHTQAVGFEIVGGTPDKSDLGIYLDQSQGVVNSVNFEGTKYPIDVRRSFISVNGCRFLSWGGLARSPENSTNASTLDIGTPESRRAGSYMIRGISARVFLAGCGINNGDAEHDLWFTDTSGPNSNSLTTRNLQRDVDSLSTNFPLTMRLDSEETTHKIYSSESVTVLGPASGQNNVYLASSFYSKGIPITEDGTRYTVPASGLYKIVFSCSLSSSSTADSCQFDLLINGVSVRSCVIPLNSGIFTLTYFARLNRTNTIQITGISDQPTLTSVLEKCQLSIKRSGNY